MVSMVTGCNSLERKTKTAVELSVNITASRHVTGSWLIGSFISKLRTGLLIGVLGVLGQKQALNPICIISLDFNQL